LNSEAERLRGKKYSDSGSADDNGNLTSLLSDGDEEGDFPESEERDLSANEAVISIRHLTKMYKLYGRNRDRIADAFGFSKKKRYREHYALRDVSFEVRKGETVGIIGTNGAGKSTILKIITGVLNQTSGEIDISGRISALLELGAGFNQEYTGIENIYLNGTMMGYSREEIEKRIPLVLEFADIGDFVYQPVKTYSSGMFVRLAFALAINIDPEILVVDEALSVGDVFFQAKCYQKFDEFKREGKTILFVSHDLSSVSKYCDRVILLNKGRKLAEGRPKEIINLYKKMLAGSDEDRAAVEKAAEEGADVREMLLGRDRRSPAGDGGQAEAGDGEIRTIHYKEHDPSFWKSHFAMNPNLEEYGNGDATMLDFAIFDEDGMLTNTIEKGTTFTLCSRVIFNRPVQNPIFTFTFKTIRGVDVTGTNTLLEDVQVPLASAGEVYEARFTQKMDLQGGEYLLSMSCTGYVKGELTAFHRCYDMVNVTVVSSKNTVGFFDMNSKTTVIKVK
jgi:teichoic acid transport system ATP-binding protein